MPEFLDQEYQELKTRLDHLTEALANLPELQAEALRQEVVAKSKEYGVFQLTQPEELGGAGAGPMALTIARETIAAANLPGGSYVFGADPGLLRHLAGDARAEFLEPVVAGEKSWSFAFTEPSGPNAPQKQTYATVDGTDLKVTGQKSFVTGGARASFYAALVNVEGEGNSGPAMVIIDKESPGLEITREFQSMEGGDHVELKFDEVVVPMRNVIGSIGEGMPRAMGNIGEERLQVSALACGMGLWTVDHITERLMQGHRSGSRLADREGIRLRYADLRIELYAARSALYRTARLAEVAESVEEIMNEATATKVFCTEMIGHVVDTAIQLAGGQSLIQGEPLEKLYRRARSLRFTGGASDILRLSIARGKFDFGAGRL